MFALTAVLLALALPPVAVAGSYVAADHFIRNISGGWGTASPGGSYSLTGRAADYWVSTASYSRGIGYMRAPANASRGALLTRTRATNVQIGFSVSITGSAGDGPFFVYAVARSSSAGEVRGKIVYNRDCTVSIGASVVAGGRERPLAPLVRAPATHWCAADRASRTMSLQMQVNGNTVRVRAWAANASAPAGWLWSSASSSLPSAGSVGLRAYASSTSRNGSTFAFYNWTAQSI